MIVGGLAVAAVLAAVVVTRGALIEDDRQATTYLLSGRADIPAGQTHDDVVVARGVVTVDGTVEDDVLVGSGRVRLNGVVHGDVVVLRGTARLGPDARIDGDLRTSATPRIREGAVVAGEVADISPLSAAGELPDALWFALWLAAGLAVLVVGLATSRPVADAARAGAGRPLRAVLLGGAVVLLAPVVLGLLALSVVGVGIALVVGGALAVASAMGAAAVATALGRLAGLRDGRVSFLAGWAALGLGLAVALLGNPLLALAGAVLVAAAGLGALVPTRRPVVHREDGPEDGDGGGCLVDPEDEALLAVFDRLDADAEDGEPTILAAFPIGSGSRS